MPSKQDLERFLLSFKAIGGEDSSGEIYEALPLPEDAGLDSELASLLNLDPAAEFSQPTTESTTEPPSALDDEPTDSLEAADFDFSAFLDSIPLDEDTSPLAEPNVPLEPPAIDLTGPEDLGETELASPAEDFGFPTELLNGLADELSESSLIDDAATKADFDTVSPETEDDELGDFDLESFKEFEQAALVEETTAAEDISHPELDDLDTGEAASDAEEEVFDLSVLEFGETPISPDPEIASTALSPADQAGFDEVSKLDEELIAAGYGQEAAQPLAESDFDSLDSLEDYSLVGIDDAFRRATDEVLEASFVIPQSTEAVEEINLTDDDFENLITTLDSYPLNLRIACQELIAEHAVPPEQMVAFVKELVRGASASAMAEQVGRLIGRPIVVPRGFEKRTGEELEAQKASFSYIFIHRILPPLRIYSLIAAIIASLVYLGAEFVYRPLRANSYYRQGYQRIPTGEYTRANEQFDRAFQIWRQKNWFYRYAEAFAAAGQYLLAEEKYDQLLNWYPRDSKGALDYAALETDSLGNYEKADRILRRYILDFNPDHREGLLALGDANLEWGATQPERYEEARKAFARVIGGYGSRDEYLERMLKYFIRTDNLAETIRLQNYFLSSVRKKITGASLAELGGYLLDKKTAPVEGLADPLIEQIENIKATLSLAVVRAPDWPEGYYHLSRYFERYGLPDQELETIEQALKTFTKAPSSSAQRDGAWIDSYRRAALLYRNQREFLLAEQHLTAGIALYENRKARKVLAASPQYGRLYADLADLELYLAGDLAAAGQLYSQAERDGWNPPEMRYRVAYIYYQDSQWDKAVEKFFSTASDFRLNRRLLYALGNAAFLRADLWTAQGYYSRLLDQLEVERSRFPILLPHERPEHAELVERLMQGRNNLGVTLATLAETTGNVHYRSQALALFAESSRAWDSLTRDDKTMARSGSVNLSFLNTRNLLQPEAGFIPQIYRVIDKDLNEPSAWEALLNY